MSVEGMIKTVMRAEFSTALAADIKQGFDVATLSEGKYGAEVSAWFTEVAKAIAIDSETK